MNNTSYIYRCMFSVLKSVLTYYCRLSCCDERVEHILCLAFTGVSDEEIQVLLASERFQLAHISVCDAVSTADWLPVPQAGLVAGSLDWLNLSADARVSNGNIGFLQAGSALKLAGVSVSLEVSTANWIVVEVASDVTGFLGSAYASVSNGNIGSLQAGSGLKLAEVSVSLGVSTANWSVVEVASDVAGCLGINTFS